MNKEDLLLKNYTILAKNPMKNRDSLQSAIAQLLGINPKLGIRCWEECINNNIAEIAIEFTKPEFSYNKPGYVLVYSFESSFLQEEDFGAAAEVFAKNKALLDVIYTKSPIAKYNSASYAISYLIRNGKLQEAENILSAIYKNKLFSDYSYLWNKIIDRFSYGEEYNPGVIDSGRIKRQPSSVKEFCVGWIERIKDEEEQAGAMTFAMQMF